MDDQPLDRATGEIGDHAVDADAAAGDELAVLAGGHVARIEAAGAEMALELERGGGLADVGIGAHGEHAEGLGPARTRHADVVLILAHLAQVDQLDRVAGGERHQVGVAVDALMQPRDHPDAVADGLVDLRLERVGEEAAGGGDADHQPLHAQADGLDHGGDDGDAGTHPGELLEVLAGVLGIDHAHHIGRTEAQHAHRGLVAEDVQPALGEQGEPAVDGGAGRHGLGSMAGMPVRPLARGSASSRDGLGGGGFGWVLYSRGAILEVIGTMRDDHADDTSGDHALASTAARLASGGERGCGSGSGPGAAAAGSPAVPDRR